MSVGGRGGHRLWACRARRSPEAAWTRSGLAGLVRTGDDSPAKRMHARRPILWQHFVDVRECMTQQEAAQETRAWTCSTLEHRGRGGITHSPP